MRERVVWQAAPVRRGKWWLLFWLWCCSACTQNLLQLPEAGGPQWTALESPHFEMMTDDDPETARKVLASFEHTYALLHDTVFQTRKQADVRTRIISFQSSSELKMIVGSDAAGIYTPRLPNDLQEYPTLLVRSEADRFNRALFAHELAHRFNDVVFGGLPVWLEEGLADYYSTIHGNVGAVKLGDIDPLLTFAPGYIRGQSGSLIVKGRIFPIERLPAASELMLQRRDGFYLWEQHGQPAIEQRSMNYGAANALVHMLMHGNSATAVRFREAFEAVRYGAPQSELREAVADLASPELDAEFREYLRSSLTWRQHHESAPQALGDVQEGQFSDVDTLLLWVQLQSFKGPHAARVGEHLDEALRRDPLDARVRYWAGRRAMLGGNSLEAESHFREAISSEPNHNDALLGLAVLYQHPNHRDRWPAETRAQLLDDTMSRFERVAESATELNVIAMYYHLAGRTDEAEQFAQRAVSASASCWNCLHTRAAIAFYRGQVGAAVRYETAAMNQAGEYDSPRVVQMLERTRSAYEQQMRASTPAQLPIELHLPE